MSETNLILGLIGMPPESARNCTQTISPIPNGEFQKTINGESIFLILYLLNLLYLMPYTIHPYLDAGLEPYFII